ncbi:MAG: hypothetical protein U1F43_10080 [Myxococcota bacterium]
MVGDDDGTLIDDRELTASEVADETADDSDGAVESDSGGDIGEIPDTADGADGTTPPTDPVAIFGRKYWEVYRPHFLAEHYDHGRVCDRITNGLKWFGDNTLWMSYALSLFVYEYRAAHLDDSLAHIDEILAAYAELDAMPANPTLGYLVADPLDGYVYRSDRGPDYETNWCIAAGGLCLPQTGARNNEPSGDQMLATLRGLSDVARTPEPLVWQGRDLKALAAAHGQRLGEYLVRDRYQMKNILGDAVKRGDDQRWASWAFERGAALVSGMPQSHFETTWFLPGNIPVAPAQHEVIGQYFLRYAMRFSSSCVGGQAIDLQTLIGVPLTVTIACNEFNVGLAGDGAVIASDTDPASARWFSTIVDRADIIDEGNALYAMYARYVFGDRDPGLYETAKGFLSAPATPPTGANLDPNGWCVAWRWGKDDDRPDRCSALSDPLTTYTGLDYLLPRAMASAFGDLPPEDR